MPRKLRHDLESWHVEAPFNPKQYMILVHLLETGQSGHELQQVTNDFMAILRQNFKRITSALNFEPLRKVTYHIYPDQKSLHAEIPNPEASKTAIGNLGGIDLIRIVSPLNPGPVYDYPFIIRSSLPLYTFSLLKQMNPRIPGWLLYGLGSYIGLNRPRTRVQNRLRLLYSQDIPSVKDLRPYGGEKFKQMAGYDLCYTMVDFIVTRYGWDALHRYIRDPDNHMDIFLCTMEQLEEAWKQFVKEQYIY
jgi:RNA polymerase sigma-70 factor (ECF subfamily)